MLVAGHRMAFAQEDLLQQLNKAANDTNKVILLNRLSADMRLKNDLAKARTYAEQASDLAGGLSYTDGRIEAMLNLGRIFEANKDYSAALNFYLQGLILGETANRASKIAQTNYAIGRVYLQNRVYPKAVKSLQLALEGAYLLARSFGSTSQK
jgi:tetratricopeptide (TPR) repeat protein